MLIEYTRLFGTLELLTQDQVQFKLVKISVLTVFLMVPLIFDGQRKFFQYCQAK